MGNQTGESSLPLTYWTGLFGILAVSINFLLEPDVFANPWTILAAVLNIACLIAISRFPLPAWAVYLVLFLLLSAQSDIRITAFTFIAPVVAATVTYRGHTATAAAGSLLLWYSGSINPSDGILLPPDLLASVIWGVLLATAVLIGYMFRRVITQRKDLIREWNTDIRTRRETLTQTLHDSVATSLTSVVMRAETLSLRPGLAAGIKSELTAIAEKARLSMKEVRDLLHILSSDSHSQSTEPDPSTSDQLQEASTLLKEHGFAVSTTGSWPNISLNADKLVFLREILAEIVINIVKYAEAGSTVDLTVSDQETHVTIGFANAVRRGVQAADLSSGLGLPTISRLTARIGGSVRTVSNSSQWKTELCLPREGL